VKILLAAKHAPHGSRPIGGVQTWCRTVAAELNARGHQATTWGPEQVAPLGGFDFGIISNIGDTGQAVRWCRKSVTVCHGIISAEKPVGDLVVYTSEEVRDHWKGTGVVIRQPIDTDFWSPDTWGLKIYLTRFSYRAGLDFVPNLAHGLDLRYSHVRNETQEKARDFLRQSGCVLATGRAALEAMACGVPVVLCDHRSAYQPPLLHLNIKRAMVQNYSGRGGVEPTMGNVLKACKDAMAAGSQRNHVMKHHDVRNIVDQLLDME